jgi:[acyl-carrier-protein] S-malonyltransferase
MALAFIVGGGLNDVPGSGGALYERHAAVRRTYAEIEEWTGLSFERLIHDPLPATELRFREGIGALRQAAVAFSIADLLAEQGVLPDVVGGLSLGAMVSASLAGAVSRAELFGLLTAVRSTPLPPEDAPPQGIAMVFTARDEAGLASLAQRAGVYPAVDVGPVGDGGYRMVMYAGYRDRLERFAAEAPEGVTVRIPPDRPVAFHSPLQRHLAEHLRPWLDAMTFRDPVIPLCSCLQALTLTTAAQVRDLFERNSVETVSVPHVRSQMRRHGVRLAIVLGPSKIDGIAEQSFPLTYVETPEDVEVALAAVNDLGLSSPARTRAGPGARG